MLVLNASLPGHQPTSPCPKSGLAARLKSRCALLESVATPALFLTALFLTALPLATAAADRKPPALTVPTGAVAVVTTSTAKISAKSQRHAPAQTAGPRYAGHPAATAFAAEVAQRRGWDENWVLRHIGQARRLTSVQQLMAPPPGAPKDWQAYRARFVEPVRLLAGAQFWQKHQRLLERAEAQYGVPADIVVGIIGVETIYGRHLGNYRALDALATLSFDFPSTARRDRSAYFRSELEELLALALRQRKDPASFRGSYAGAWGLPQFMPGSVNRHAVDYDGNGRIDLLHSPADVIGSVANYMAAHGWQPGMATHYAVTPPADPAARAALLAPDILPSFSPAQMEAQGATLSSQGRAHSGPLALVELQNGLDAPQFVAGTANFYAITRYNWSSFYAMAVIELGAALAAQRRAP
jgi:membrane-bound lytic murein transglycosylase B